jgi:hypothetical protein
MPPDLVAQQHPDVAQLDVARCVPLGRCLLEEILARALGYHHDGVMLLLQPFP